LVDLKVKAMHDRLDHHGLAFKNLPSIKIAYIPYWNGIPIEEI
jgi:hypothetical protein